MLLKNILLINNNLEFYSEEIRFLEEEGYNITTAGTSEEALNILSRLKNHFDLILLDPILKTIDEGISTARIIIEELKIPLLFYTDITDDKTVRQTDVMNSYGYIIKSTGKAVLNAAINRTFKAVNRYAGLNTHEDILSRLVIRINESNLSVNNEGYSYLISKLEDGIIVENKDGQIITANSNATKIMGLSRDELRQNITSRKDWEFIHEDFTPFPVEEHPAIVTRKTGEIQKEITMGIRKDKEILIWIIMTSQPIFKSDNRTLAGIVTSFRDITEEINLKESNLKWNNIFRNAEWGIVVGKADSGTLDLMNPAYARMHGYTVEELLGKPISDVFAPEEKALVPEHIAKAHKLGHYRFESMHIKKDGTPFPAIMEITTINDSMGNPLYRAGSVIDITERKKQEQELKKSKEYSESLFWNSPCAIYSVDRNCRVVDFNKKAEEITGYLKEEVIGKEFNMFSEELSSTEKVGREYKIITKQNREKVIERYNTLLYDNDDNIIGDIESFIDITNWKELEDFKSDIERIIRHDLKTPLNSIIGFPKMMLTDESLSDEYKEYLMIILAAGQNMLNLINASLNMYKLEEGSFQFNMAETNVLSILKQINIELREIIQRKKCRIKILIEGNPLTPDSVIKIQSEKNLLYMTLTNLIKNALEASPKNEIVTVNLSDKDKLLISIHNIGTIPEQIRDSFFDKHVTSGKSNGNGLGTYSAKLMADALNATIEFTTDEIDGTTLFLAI